MTFFCEAEADRLARRCDPRNPSRENARSDTSELPETLSVFGRTCQSPSEQRHLSFRSTRRQKLDSYLNSVIMNAELGRVRWPLSLVPAVPTDVSKRRATAWPSPVRCYRPEPMLALRTSDLDVTSSVLAFLSASCQSPVVRVDASIEGN